MRVLLVEDDRRLAFSLRRNLGEAGIAADAVHDGEEGLEAARTTAYDVILLDVMLPDLDGMEVSRRLRQARVHTPILMLTARDSVDDRVGGLESGADDYLVKPFAMRDVVARIRALARRHLPERSGLLTAGRVDLDTGGHILRVDGKVVELTAKEFAILEYFLLNRGRLLTRTQIIEHVWDYDFEGGRNLVEVYVGRLRRKLTEAGAPDPFATVRGAGYRYDSDGE
jgi:DNA-binding response OmpR family regulator